MQCGNGFPKEERVFASIPQRKIGSVTPLNIISENVINHNVVGKPTTL